MLYTKFLQLLKNDYLLYTLIGLGLGLIVVLSPELGILLAFALLGVLVISEDPIHAVALLIILTPFSGTLFLKDSFMDIPGAKPIQLFAIYVIFLAALNHKLSAKMPDIGRRFLIVLLLIFAVSIIRSLPHLDQINLLAEDKLTEARYLLSELVKPLLFLTPFFIILRYISDFAKLEFVLRSMITAVLLLSIFVLFLYFFKVPDKTDVAIISEYYSETMSLHRNNLATFYIIVFPFVLANYFLRKNLKSMMILGVILAGVGFLYSRGAYLTVMLSFLFYLIISKRTKYLPVLIIVGLIGISFMATSIIERATLGWESGDMEEISAGRVDNIWLPVLYEYAEKPLNLIFGDGRYAVTQTDAARMERMLPVGHPHNMYLEMLIDAGLTGLVVILLFFFKILKDLFRHLTVTQHQIIREYQIAAIVSICAFLFSGLTDRSFFPNLENCFLWTVLALSIKMNSFIRSELAGPSLHGSH